MLQDSFSEQPDLPTSLLCFILFTGYLFRRGSNTNCLCFALRSFLITLPSTFQNFFTFTLLTGSSALLQTPECSYEQSPVVSALSLTRLVIWNQLPVSVCHSTCQLFYIFLENLSLFKNLFFSLIALICDWCVCVCACVRACAGLCVCVRACVHSCFMR